MLVRMDFLVDFCGNIDAMDKSFARYCFKAWARC